MKIDVKKDSIWEMSNGDRLIVGEIFMKNGVFVTEAFDVRGGNIVIVNVDNIYKNMKHISDND